MEIFSSPLPSAVGTAKKGCAMSPALDRQLCSGLLGFNFFDELCFFNDADETSDRGIVLIGYAMETGRTSYFLLNDFLACNPNYREF